MRNDPSRAMERDQYQRFTVGVIGNRQIYEGTTIVRYEQILLRGICAAARQYGCNLLLACGAGPDIEPYEGLAAWPVKLPQTSFVPVGPWNTSGLIAIPPFSDAQQRAFQELVPPDHPIVFTFPQEGYPSVGPANGDGIAQAFAHLVAHGHRRIAFIAADVHAVGDGAERLSAYRSAVTAHGLPLDSALIGYGGHNVHESYHALRQMLDAGVDFTAVLTSNDESAIGVLRMLANAGRRVPEDVAVIGFDCRCSSGRASVSKCWGCSRKTCANIGNLLGLTVAMKITEKLLQMSCSCMGRKAIAHGSIRPSRSLQQFSRTLKRRHFQPSITSGSTNGRHEKSPRPSVTTL